MAKRRQRESDGAHSISIDVKSFQGGRVHHAAARTRRAQGKEVALRFHSGSERTISEPFL
jgi:hypothetical protein